MLCGTMDEATPANPFAELVTGKKNKPYAFFEATVNPGETASLGVPLPELLGCAPLYLPVKIVHGKTEGPTLLLFATMRGDDFNGMEIIKRVTEKAAAGKLRGTLVTAPVLNVFGMMNRSRGLPGGQLLEHAFPGDESGSYAARTAHLFVERLFAPCDVCVGLSSGRMNHNVLPHIYTDFEVTGNREFAEVFPVSVIDNIDPEPGTLPAVARERGKPMLSYRAGEAMRFNRKAIQLGTRGLMRLLRRLDMLPADGHETPAASKPVICKASEWVYSTKSGIARLEKGLGDKVSQGDLLARISEPLAGSEEVRVVAPNDGVVVGLNDIPLVYEGDSLVRLARFEQMEEAASAVRQWSEEPAAAEPETPGEQPGAEA